MSTKKGGFTPPNYTQVPNTLFDLLPVMSNAELRVTLALARETFGWHRQRTEMMSVPELAAKSGQSDSSTKTGIREGQQRGTIKRTRARDERNRPTYKYGLVISDETNFEEFERARKQVLDAAQDDAQHGLSSQNLTGSEIDGVSGLSGQNLPGSPDGLSSQNLTGSYKEERKSSKGKKVVEHNAVSGLTPGEAERDDDFPFEEDEETSGVEGEEQAHTPVTGAVAGPAGGDVDEDASGGEDVPPAAAWDPAAVNAELQVLTNRRWLKPWRARGATDLNPPLIDEVDGSGVDRHRIATCISPEQLAEIVAGVRAERTRLNERGLMGESVQVFTFQHMLIQELQRTVDRTDSVRALVAEATTAREDEGGEATPSAPAPRLTLGQPREWAVGDVVSYRREQYTITQVTDRKLTLDNEYGDLDIIRATSEIGSVKLVTPAPRAAGASA